MKSIDLRLVINYLKKQPKKAFSLILSIIICCSLITTVGIIFSSLSSNMDEFSKKVSGNYLYTVKNLSAEQADNLKNDESVSKAGLSYSYGNLSFNNSTKPLTITSLDTNALEMTSIEILEGVYPKNSSEIMISESFAYSKKTPIKIGDNIEGNITLQYIAENGSNKTHSFNNTFTVSGIVKAYPGSEFSKYYLGVVSVDTVNSDLKNNMINRSVYIDFHNTKSINAVLMNEGNLSSRYDIDSSNFYSNPNIFHLMQNGNVMSIPGVLLGIIVLFAASLVIYNIFNMSVLNRIKDYGIYRCLGFRPKRIRKLVLTEAVILSAVGIPMGLLLGFIISSLIYSSIVSMSNIGVTSLTYSYLIFVIAAVVSFVSVILSTLIPAIHASKVSPLEAVRNTSDSNSKLKFKKKNGKSFLSKILSPSRFLAYKNLWRYKKRTYLTILSLSFSTILLVSFTYYFTHFPMMDPSTKYTAGEFRIRANDVSSSGDNFTEKDVDNISNISGIKKVTSTKYHYSTISLKESNLTEEFKAMPRNNLRFKNGIYTLYSFVHGYSPELLSDLSPSILEGSLDIKDNQVIVHKSDFTDSLNFSIGDEIDLTYISKYDSSGDNHTYETNTFTIGCIVDSMPYGYKISGKGIPIIMKNSTFDEFYKTDGYQQVDIKIDNTVDHRLLSGSLIALASDKGEVTSFFDEISELEKAKKLMNLLMYSFIGFIMFMCVINITNTMNTSILTRKNEFGILKALGFNKRRIRDVIIFEGLFYGILSSIIGIGISLLLCRLMYIATPDMKSGSPIFIAILALILNLVCCALSSLKPLSIITKSNIVDSIKALD